MISIALATYNGSKYIREQIDSIRNQTFTDFEVIACDDCSTDETAAILHEYEKKDSRFHVYQNPQNLGFKKNFEHILTLCKGDYIAFCDQDDVWTRDHLEILYSNIGNADCIGTNSEFIDSDGTPLNTTMTQYLLIQRIPQSSQLLYEHELFGNMIQGTASLFSKELLEKALPLPEGIKFHDYWIALNACIGKGCKYINQPSLKYRRHSGNATEYDRFSFFKTVKKINKLSQNKAAYYEDFVLMLRNLQKKEMTPHHRISLEKALQFYEKLSSNTNRLQSTWFYIRNYKKITLTNYTHILAFGFRALSILIFGIRY